MIDKKLVRKIIHWGLLVIILIFIITGLGIARYRIIETITLGLLSKPISYQIHSYLIFPLIIFLYLHILITWKKRKER
jgi:thiosulfate reductase cytochrome b subunit